MKKTMAAALLLGGLVVILGSGCGFGPAHLPALTAQRDRFQRHIDEVVDRMLTDKAWWDSQPPEAKRRWKEYLERMQEEERDRALNAIQTLTEGLNRLDARTSEKSKGKEEASGR